jgi:hypothetical protein
MNPIFVPDYWTNFRPEGAIRISVEQRPTIGFLLENKALKGRKPEYCNHNLTLLLSPLQGFGVLYLLRRALPYANAGCPVGAILVNIHFETKTEFSSVMSIADTSIRILQVKDED